MFTGIIECLGVVRNVKNTAGTRDITVGVKEDFLQNIKLGDSIAVNGVCLTVVAFDVASFTVQMIRQTCDATNLGVLKIHDKVNLEKALLVGGRMDGHFVQGHVDGRGAVQAIIKENDGFVVRVAAEKELLDCMVLKGSVTLDGVSLTIQSLNQTSFSVAIIPHTYQVTTLRDKAVGSSVNIECDVLGKYVYAYMQKGISAQKGLSLDALKENGF